MKKSSQKLLIFSGMNRRYKYVVNQLLDCYPHTSLIVQRNIKGDYVGKYDHNNKFEPDVIRLINAHLQKRDEIESIYYREDFFHLKDNHNILEVDSETLNLAKTVEFIKAANASIAFSFGIGMLKEPVLTALNRCQTVNLHLGLAPYYRSSDTLLWPLYLQNPGHVGLTLHAIDDEPDHGPIYHQQKTIFAKGDRIHDIFCKTVVQAVEPTIKLVDLFMKGIKPRPVISHSVGKFFLKGEFTPNHLNVIYELINQGMLDKDIEGKWQSKDLKLYSCFARIG